MNDQEQAAISDLLRTVRLGLIIMALAAGAVGHQEILGLI